MNKPIVMILSKLIVMIPSTASNAMRKRAKLFSVMSTHNLGQLDQPVILVVTKKEAHLSKSSRCLVKFKLGHT